MRCCDGNCSQCPLTKIVTKPTDNVAKEDVMAENDKALSLVVKKTFTGKLKAVKEK